jgi:hypothetical protein
VGPVNKCGRFIQDTPVANEIGIFWLRCYAADCGKLCGTAAAFGAFPDFVTMTAEPARA